MPDKQRNHETHEVHSVEVRCDEECRRGDPYTGMLVEKTKHSYLVSVPCIDGRGTVSFNCPACGGYVEISFGASWVWGWRRICAVFLGAPAAVLIGTASVGLLFLTGTEFWRSDPPLENPIIPILCGLVVTYILSDLVYTALRRDRVSLRAGAGGSGIPFGRFKVGTFHYHRAEEVGGFLNSFPMAILEWILTLWLGKPKEESEEAPKKKQRD